MMWTDNTYRVVFFGHRNFNDHRTVDEKFLPLLKRLFLEKPYVELYIGRNGEFDIYAAMLVKHAQNAMGKANNELIAVFPYTQKHMEYFQNYYDTIIIPECSQMSHPKYAITKRNKWMVEQADLFVCYVKYKKGGAYTALKYAKKLNKEIVNLAEDKI